MNKLLGMLLAMSLGTSAVAAETPRRPWLDPTTGRPFFPLGWFEWETAVIAGPTGPEALEKAKASLDAMADEGANTVLFVNSWAAAADDAQLEAHLALWREYLDHAQTRQIKVLAHVGGDWVRAFQEPGHAEAVGRFQKWVQAVSPHPALLGYQLFDEPEYQFSGQTEEDAAKRCLLREGLKGAHDAIHQWDPHPNHLVQAVFNLVPHQGYTPQNWQEFLPALDTFQVDRYPINRQFLYFPHGPGTVGEWGALRCAWQIAHAVAAIEATAHRDPAIVLQGMGKNYYEGGYHWRDPLYEETRYMAYSSLTAGAWGVFHWIRNVSPPGIRRNVARLYAELRELRPALEASGEKPPFTVSHNHEQITRNWLHDRVLDVSTLALEDEKNYYLIAVDNTGVFEDLTFRLKLPGLKGTQSHHISVLNEDWGREIHCDAQDGAWVIPQHTMCFGDVDIFVVPKEVT